MLVQCGALFDQHLDRYAARTLEDQRQRERVVGGQRCLHALIPQISFGILTVFSDELSTVMPATFSPRSKANAEIVMIGPASPLLPTLPG